MSHDRRYIPISSNLKRGKVTDRRLSVLLTKADAKALDQTVELCQAYAPVTFSAFVRHAVTRYAHDLREMEGEESAIKKEVRAIVKGTYADGI